MKFKNIFLFILCSYFFIACGSNNNSINPNSHYYDSKSKRYVEKIHNISSAPAPIQKAAQAIVKIVTSYAAGTGFFISPSVLITNHHVVGKNQCFQSGCYVKLYFNYQKEKPYQEKWVYVKIKKTSKNLDISLLNVYNLDKKTKFESPFYLTPAYYSYGVYSQHTYVIGHPFGDLKKWTESDFLEISKKGRIHTHHIIFHGNSGSPLLSDQGDLIGIVNMVGVSQSSFESYGSLLSYDVISSLSKPKENKAILFKSKDSISTKTLLDRLNLYQNAKISKVSLKDDTDTTTTKNILEILFDACQKKVNAAKNGVLLSTPIACQNALLWIDCDPNSSTKGPFPQFKTCPNDSEKWENLFRSLTRKRYANFYLTTENIILAKYLAKTKSDRIYNMRIATEDLIYNHYISDSWYFISFLSQFSDSNEAFYGKPSRNSTKTFTLYPFKRLTHYTNYSYSEENLSTIAFSLNHFYERNQLSKETLFSLLTQIQNDEKISIRTFFDIEALKYEYSQ